MGINKKNVFNSEITYTDSEIKSIKENLQKAFGVDTLALDLRLDNLLKDKINTFKFKKGDRFVFFNAHPNHELKLCVGWHEIEITYTRLDLIFYKILSNNTTNEHWATRDSFFFYKQMMPRVIDLKRYGIPEKNLPLISFDKGNRNPYEITIIKSNETYTI
jgi:hypothetical protein